MAPSRTERSIARYGDLAHHYDRSTARMETTREAAVDRLALRRGETVLDVACGTGAAFPHVEERIGPEGRLVGIDQSPHMLARARERVRESGWRNVTLIEAPVEVARIPEPVDALLFMYAHDVVRSMAALDNVFRSARDGARVACAGWKTYPRWLFPVNAYLVFISRNYVTNREGLRRPWDLLPRFVPDLQVEFRLLGSAYLAHGFVRMKR